MIAQDRETLAKAGHTIIFPSKMVEINFSSDSDSFFNYNLSTGPLEETKASIYDPKYFEILETVLKRADLL